MHDEMVGLTGVLIAGLTVVTAEAADRRTPPPTVYWIDSHTQSGFSPGSSGMAAMMAMGSDGPQRVLTLRLTSTLACR